MGQRNSFNVGLDVIVTNRKVPFVESLCGNIPVFYSMSYSTDFETLQHLIDRTELLYL